MTINQVQCDGCGKGVDAVRNFDKYNPPITWSKLDGFTIKNQDLCPDCTKKVEEFIQGLKV